MPYIRLDNGKRFEEHASSLYAIIDKYNDENKYAVIIGGNLVYVVVKKQD